MVNVHDATLVTIGTDFCAKLRAGIPARQVMQNAVETITAEHLSGQITDAQEAEPTMAGPDLDRTATIHYCPEQFPQVMRAVAQMATGN